MFRSVQRAALLSSHLKAKTPIDKVRGINILPRPSSKMSHLFEGDTPDEVKNAKGLHLITMSTPNGQKVQIMLEELHEIYGTEWTYSLLYVVDSPPLVFHQSYLPSQTIYAHLTDVFSSFFFSNIMTNDQKKDWFLRLDPNGRIPILVDHTQSPPFPVMETSAELLYLLKFADKDDVFGFKDELERSQALQWLFFWHGSGAP